MVKTFLLLFASLIGNTEPTIDLQATINNAIVQIQGDDKGRLVQIPPGVYTLTQTLKIPSNIGIIVDGGTAGGTIIQWSGPSDQNMIEMSGCHHGELRNISLICVTECDTMLKITRQQGERYISTACTIDNVLFGNNQLKCNKCVDIKNPPEFDQNNELHRFRRCEFTGYKTNAVHISGSQIHGIVFEDCGMFAGLGADYGVYAEYGCFFYWLRGSGGYHRSADFRLGRFQIVTSIDGWNSEGSGALLHSDKSDWNPSPVNIKNCRWQGRGDTYTVSILHPGPLNIENNTIICDAGRPTIRTSGLTGHRSGQIAITGNTIYSSIPITQVNPLAILTNDFVLYERGNVFSVSGTPGQGDQLQLTNGYPLATLTQPGMITPQPQNYTANKAFVNTSNNTTGIGITSVHMDGRTKLGNLVGSGSATFWNRMNLVTCDGQWSFPSLTAANRTVFHAAGASPFSSDGNGLHFDMSSASGEYATASFVTMRYAGYKQPELVFGARQHRFGIVPDGNNGTMSPGKIIMMITDQGVKIGNILLTPTDDGDIKFSSPKFNGRLLSEILH